MWAPDQLRHAVELHAGRTTYWSSGSYRRQTRSRVRNYFYTDTVEERIYAGIKEDYDWFTDIVGPAQPVLGQIEGVIETVAMTSPSQNRDQEIGQKVAEIRDAIEKAKARALSLEDLGTAPDATAENPRAAIDLLGLERVLLGVDVTSQRFHPHPDFEGVYLLDTSKGKVEVTFRRSVLEKYAPEVRLLTYGTEELRDLLTLSGVPVDVAPLEGFPDTLEEMQKALESP